MHNWRWHISIWGRVGVRKADFQSIYVGRAENRSEINGAQHQMKTYKGPMIIYLDNFSVQAHHFTQFLIRALVLVEGFLFEI